MCTRSAPAHRRHPKYERKSHPKYPHGLGWHVRSGDMKTLGSNASGVAVFTGFLYDLVVWIARTFLRLVFVWSNTAEYLYTHVSSSNLLIAFRTWKIA